jgi:glutamate synthase (NADPH/NADH) large chain
VLEEMADAPAKAARSNLSLLDRQQAFGYSQEDLSVLMTPMASTGEEAAGSMGTDTPLSALSNKPKSLFTYFKQNFAQVTNPPIDPIREELVMSLVSIIGPRPNLFDIEGLSKTKRLEVRQPILTDADLEKSARSPTSPTTTSSRARSTPPSTPASGLRAWSRCWKNCAAAPKLRCARHQHHHPVGPRRRKRPHSDSVAAGDRRRASSPDPHRPAHLGRPRRSGEPREVHHFACLAGYGAEAINPYLAFDPSSR